MSKIDDILAGIAGDTFDNAEDGEGNRDEVEVNKTTTSVGISAKDVNKKDETVESIVDDLLLGHRAWADLYLGGKTLVHEKRIINNRKVRAISAINAHYRAKYEGLFDKALETVPMHPRQKMSIGHLSDLFRESTARDAELDAEIKLWHHAILSATEHFRERLASLQYQPKKEEK